MGDKAAQGLSKEKPTTAQDVLAAVSKAVALANAAQRTLMTQGMLAVAGVLNTAAAMLAAEDTVRNDTSSKYVDFTVTCGSSGVNYNGRILADESPADLLTAAGWKDVDGQWQCPDDKGKG